MITVDNYVGSTINAALAKAQSDGLSVGESVYINSEEAAGTVLDQSLSSGINVAEGTLITFTVSKGPAQEVNPDNPPEPDPTPTPDPDPGEGGGN